MAKGIDEESGIWSLEVAKKKHRFDPLLAARISMMFQPKRAADLGCGIGRYCAILKACGWPIVDGYEGTPDIKEIAVYDNIMPLDLTKKRWVDIDYDFVLSLEIGEHIPKKHEQTFLDNIREFTKKDLILSWAIPGQGGTGHFNERSNEYVISELAKRDLIFDEKKTKELRKYTSLKWFRNTILVFEDGKKISTM